MKVYAAIDNPRMQLAEIPAHARRAEALGFSGLLIPEAAHDGFLAAALALEHSDSLLVATNVVLAFPRSPVVTAYSAWDLQQLSGGRFQLGLGSQVKANIEGRFGVEWTAPVARMRDYIAALRAVWNCWQTGSSLNFESDNYKLNRIQPFFNPGPIENPDIPIFLGAVNEHMTRLALHSADGLMTHPTASAPRFIEAVIRPLIEARGDDTAQQRRAPASETTVATASGSTACRNTPKVIASTFIATGIDTSTVTAERERMRKLLGFLYSTPQYHKPLEMLGHGPLGKRLHRLSRTQSWAEMETAVGDEVLDEIVLSGTYEEIPELIAQRYGHLVDAVTLRMPADKAGDGALRRTLDAISGHGDCRR